MSFFDFDRKEQGELYKWISDEKTDLVTTGNLKELKTLADEKAKEDGYSDVAWVTGDVTNMDNVKTPFPFKLVNCDSNKNGDYIYEIRRFSR